MGRTDDPHPHIHRLRALGMSDDVILNRLLLEGWPREMLEPIFAARGSLEGHENAPLSATPPAAGRKNRTSPVVVLVTIFAAGALGAATYMYFQPPVVYSISLPGETASSTTLELSYGPLPSLSDPDRYFETKKSLQEQKVSFIDADLSSMRLTVYKDGEQALSVPIAAKGKVGSWWETPAGIYKIQSKERDHFSSFGKVHQPYSLAFQGNFFIHGWPYYPDGAPVAQSYSGGCIRLSTEDAESVFALAGVGMPVIVYNAPNAEDDFSYQLKAPKVSANAYLVADARNGTVLTSKNPQIAAPIASVSKFVTALVATEYINLDKEIAVPADALVYTSVPRLRAGEAVRAYDLLFLLLQESSNEAAEVLASATGRAQFVRYMNEKAKAIGLPHTVFSDVSGAKGDYSTPEDLFTLLRYIAENRRFVFGITAGTIKDSAYGAPSFKNILNFNLVKNSNAILLGGKVGQTREASETYAGTFQLKVGGEVREIAVIVLGSKDSIGDVRKLLSFVEATYAPGESK
jgi:D-alanyl-D-alanine carboxypeptidase